MNSEQEKKVQIQNDEKQLEGKVEILLEKMDSAYTSLEHFISASEEREQALQTISNYTKLYQEMKLQIQTDIENQIIQRIEKMSLIAEDIEKFKEKNSKFEDIENIKEIRLEKELEVQSKEQAVNQLRYELQVETQKNKDIEAKIKDSESLLR